MTAIITVANQKAAWEKPPLRQFVPRRCRNEQAHAADLSRSAANSRSRFTIRGISTSMFDRAERRRITLATGDQATKYPLLFLGPCAVAGKLEQSRGHSDAPFKLNDRLTPVLKI